LAPLFYPHEIPKDHRSMSATMRAIGVPRSL
jgi:hypothetical protein